MQKRREDNRRARFSANATFEAVAKAWIAEQKAHWSVDYLDKIERRLAKNAYPWLGKRPIAEITTPEYVEQVIRRARDRGVLDTARRVRETCNCVFRHAVENGLIKSSENPVIDPGVGGVRTPPADPPPPRGLVRASRARRTSMWADRTGGERHA